MFTRKYLELAPQKLHATAKARPMPPHQRLRLNDRDDMQNRRKPSWIRNQRSLFVSLTRPGTLRRKTIN